MIENDLNKVKSQYNILKDNIFEDKNPKKLKLKNKYFRQKTYLNHQINLKQN